MSLPGNHGQPQEERRGFLAEGIAYVKIREHSDGGSLCLSLIFMKTKKCRRTYIYNLLFYLGEMLISYIHSII